MDQEFAALQAQMATLQSASQLNESNEVLRARNEVFGGPPPVIAVFYVDAEKDDQASTPECPIYIEGVYVYLKITDPGGDAISSKATEDHIRRFPKEYEAFKRNMENRTIKLEALPQMRPSVLRAFKDLGIFSVEDVIDKPVPEYLQKYKQWAVWIKSVHERAAGRKMRVVA